MLRIKKRLIPLEIEGAINRLQAENDELRAIMEEQADALIEIAEIVTGGEE